MKVDVLGCHGSDSLVRGPQGPIQCGTCGFLVNDHVLVDAGTIGARLYLEDQKRIRLVLLTHLHFDHIRALPTLADNLVGEIDEPVVVAAIPEVLKGLATHIFNGDVYPDFFRLPDPAKPIFVPHALKPGREEMLGGLGITAVPVNHVGPAVGFLIRDGEKTVLMSGDTHRTDEIWRAAKQSAGLRAAFIECSFPNELSELAEVSRHLTPALLAQEYSKLESSDLPVFAYHLKPRFRERIRTELGRTGIPRVTVLAEGQTLQF
ncbi:MAG: 3',5'-cyclic-nucleotide phosphodiesterase [Nitrospiraceae bacterium]|nr:3',5'-cyclic-nucleotide phosphodiesterase [Nitrospiraceae bacterium]